MKQDPELALDPHAGLCLARRRGTHPGRQGRGYRRSPGAIRRSPRSSPTSCSPTGNEPALTLDDIRAAARRIEGRVLRTPLRASSWLSAMPAADVRLKLETRQPTSSYKVRGRIQHRAADGRENGDGGSAPPLVTASAGNHGRALAWAVRAGGMHAHGIRAAACAAHKARGHCRERSRPSCRAATTTRRSAAPRSTPTARARCSSHRTAIPTSSPAPARLDSRFSTTGQTSTRSSCRSAVAG